MKDEDFFCDQMATGWAIDSLTLVDATACLLGQDNTGRSKEEREVCQRTLPIRCRRRARG